MSSKGKIFVLYSLVTRESPRIFKSKATIRKYLAADPNLAYYEFLSMNEAKQYVASLEQRFKALEQIQTAQKLRQTAKPISEVNIKDNKSEANTNDKSSELVKNVHNEKVVESEVEENEAQASDKARIKHSKIKRVKKIDPTFPASMQHKKSHSAVFHHEKQAGLAIKLPHKTESPSIGHEVKQEREDEIQLQSKKQKQDIVSQKLNQIPQSEQSGANEKSQTPKEPVRQTKQVHASSQSIDHKVESLEQEPGIQVAQEKKPETIAPIATMEEQHKNNKQSIIQTETITQNLDQLVQSNISGQTKNEAISQFKTKIQETTIVQEVISKQEPVQQIKKYFALQSLELTTNQRQQIVQQIQRKYRWYRPQPISIQGQKANINIGWQRRQNPGFTRGVYQIDSQGFQPQSIDFRIGVTRNLESKLLTTVAVLADVVASDFRGHLTLQIMEDELQSARRSLDTRIMEAGQIIQQVRSKGFRWE